MKFTAPLKDIIKDNRVHFVSLRKTLDGSDYMAEYKIAHCTDGAVNNWYHFTVPLSDIGTGILLAEDKAIYYMRWIKKAIENDEFWFRSQTQCLQKL